MQEIIRIENLSKSFKEVKAVKELSFSVNEGELFAFLGVNGAGKSTTISIMCGQLKKDNGKVFINGFDIDNDKNSIKRNIGAVFQNSVLDKALNVYDNLKSRAALYGISGKMFEKRLDEISNMLELHDLHKRTLGRLSGGQRRRVDIARALVHDPKILILDEPTTGLDPQSRKKVWDCLAQLRKNRNMTVFLTTHYMEETADADRVLIIDDGRICAMGTPLELKNKYSGDFVSIYGISEAEVQMLKRPYEKIVGGYRLFVNDTAQAVELIMRHGELFGDFEITKGRMDDVFLAVTGKQLLGRN
ncbi:MAG: ABC transporter ATP-binding protein [Clostridia bacterium]|nr:ABC transporter ATP-binding protein [Clostridia bacterium]